MRRHKGMRTHRAFIRKILEQPAVKAEYDAQTEDFALLEELLKARRAAGLTQPEVTPPAVADINDLGPIT
jgi:hypothetical protein